MRFHIDKLSLKTVFIYYIFGYCWVFLTNRLFFVPQGGQQVPVIPYIKGTIFVTVTGIFVYYLIRRQFHKEKLFIKEKQKVIQEREVILKELNHRVKNNLQVLESFLQLEMANTEDNAECTEVLQRLFLRLQSISAVHHNLYNLPNTPFVDLRTVFIQALPSYTDYFLCPSSDITLKHDIDDVHVPIYIAVPLSLVTNELLVNSCKHAYPAGMKGDIYLSVKRMDDSIRVVVSDTGIGFCNDMMDNERCLGLVLVKALLDQVEGKLEKQDSPAGGTTFTVDIPYACSEDVSPAQAMKS